MSTSEYQAKLGSSIASNTDNKYVAKAASNKTLQKGAGSAIGFLARNKTVQKKTGSMIAKKAQDEELQKKVRTPHSTHSTHRTPHSRIAS